MSNGHRIIVAASFALECHQGGEFTVLWSFIPRALAFALRWRGKKVRMVEEMPQSH